MLPTKLLYLAIALALPATPVTAQGGTFGGVFFPQGESSFADAVALYDPAFSGGAVPSINNEPLDATSVPDDLSCTLGDGGKIELSFTDNLLTNSGDATEDLWIFEIGPQVEDTFVAVRPQDSVTLALITGVIPDADLDGFFELGKVFGATSGIDLDVLVPGLPAETLRFDAVQLLDDLAESCCGGTYPGADIDAVGAIGSLQVFSGDVESLSLASGGSQVLTIDAGASNAGGIYLVLGSITGDAPGTQFGSALVPLNFDFYTQYTLTNPNSPVLQGSLGLLNAQGSATATFSLPAGFNPGFAGVTVHHAYGLLGTSFVSNPVQIELLP